MLPHRQLLYTMVYVHEQPLFGFAKWHKTQTFEVKSLPDCGQRKTISLLHGGHIKNHPVGLHGRKNQAEGGHSLYKSRPSRALLYEFVQTLLCLNASKSPSRCFLPSAFTPSNINMLAPLNDWKTIGQAEPSAKYARSRHWWLQNQPLFAATKVVPVWSR